MKEGRGIRRMERMEKCELLRSCYDYLVLNPVSLQNRSSSSCRLQSSLFAFVLNASACNEVVMREQFSQIHSPNSGRNDRSLGLSKEDETYIVNSLLHSSSSPSYPSSSLESNRNNDISLESGLQFATHLQAFKEEIIKRSLQKTSHQQGEIIDMTTTSTISTASSSSSSSSSPNVRTASPSNINVLQNAFKPPSMKQPENNSNNSNVFQHSRPRNTNAIGRKRGYGDVHCNNTIANKRSNDIDDDKNVDNNDMYLNHGERGEKKNPFKSGKDRFVEDGGSFPVPPPSNQQSSTNVAHKLSQRVFNNPGSSSSASSSSKSKKDQSKDLPPELAHLNPQIVEKIEGDILHKEHNQIKFADISGLEFAKKNVQELIVWPICRPDIFTGLRALPKGLLLFGPPGTGKTLIGKAIAHESGATFFSISASSLTSKWIGEGEMAVRTLFAVAAYYQPSVVFMDEVDSLLTQRSSEENEASRRIKTEFLVQLDGAGTDQNARIVVIGATNRPDELDEAARRRFVKRIYVPLPDVAGRRQMIVNLLKDQAHTLNEQDVMMLLDKTNGYSGADIRSVGTEAAMGPCREMFKSAGGLHDISVSDMPPIRRDHFEEALESVAPSVSKADLQRYVEWNSIYGSYRKME